MVGNSNEMAVFSSEKCHQKKKKKKNKTSR